MFSFYLQIIQNNLREFWTYVSFSMLSNIHINKQTILASKSHISVQAFYSSPYFVPLSD